MVGELTGHSQAEVPSVLIIDVPGTLNVGALSAVEVGNCSLPTLKPAQESLHAGEVVGKRNIFVYQRVDLGKGQNCVSCDFLGNKIMNEVVTPETL